MSHPIWSGLAIVDADGRTVVWPSHAPKVYHSEEQGRCALGDGCEFVPVVLVRVTPDEFAAARRGGMPELTMIPTPPVRLYRPRHCTFIVTETGRSCGALFTPEGARAEHCPAHRRRRKSA